MSKKDETVPDGETFEIEYQIPADWDRVPIDGAGELAYNYNMDGKNEVSEYLEAIYYHPESDTRLLAYPDPDGWCIAPMSGFDPNGFINCEVNGGNSGDQTAYELTMLMFTISHAVRGGN
jgi:hypothetical protein